LFIFAFDGIDMGKQLSFLHPKEKKIQGEKMVAIQPNIGGGGDGDGRKSYRNTENTNLARFESI